MVPTPQCPFSTRAFLQPRLVYMVKHIPTPRESIFNLPRGPYLKAEKQIPRNMSTSMKHLDVFIYFAYFPTWVGGIGEAISFTGTANSKSAQCLKLHTSVRLPYVLETNLQTKFGTIFEQSTSAVSIAGSEQSPNNLPPQQNVIVQWLFKRTSHNPLNKLRTTTSYNHFERRCTRSR